MTLVSFNQHDESARITSYVYVYVEENNAHQDTQTSPQRQPSAEEQRQPLVTCTHEVCGSLTTAASVGIASSTPHGALHCCCCTAIERKPRPAPTVKATTNVQECWLMFGIQCITTQSSMQYGRTTTSTCIFSTFVLRRLGVLHPLLLAPRLFPICDCFVKTQTRSSIVQGGMFCDGYSFVLTYVRTRKTADCRGVVLNQTYTDAGYR